MVARREDVKDRLEEALDVRREQPLLLRPEEALHGRSRQVERAVALAVDTLPRLILRRVRGSRRLRGERRPPTPVGAVARSLTREQRVGAGQAERDRLDRYQPAHLLVKG